MEGTTSPEAEMSAAIDTQYAAECEALVAEATDQELAHFTEMATENGWTDMLDETGAIRPEAFSFLLACA